MAEVCVFCGKYYVDENGFCPAGCTAQAAQELVDAFNSNDPHKQQAVLRKYQLAGDRSQFLQTAEKWAQQHGKTTKKTHGRFRFQADTADTSDTADDVATDTSASVDDANVCPGCGGWKGASQDRCIDCQ